MPLYEYECDDCGHRFELIRKFSDPPVSVCPACGGRVRKLVSSPAIQFKGTGWYVTDYARKPASEPGKSAEGPEGRKTDKARSKDAPAPSGDSKTADSAASKATGAVSPDRSERPATAARGPGA